MNWIRVGLIALLATVLIGARAEPGASAAVTGASAPGSARVCVYPDVLRKLGENGAAKTEYLRLLKQNPDLTCATSALRELNKEKGLWENIRDDPVKWLVGGLGVVAAGLLLTVLFWYVFLGIVGRIPLIKKAVTWMPVLSPKLELEGFDGDSVDPKMGSGVAALVRGIVRPRGAGSTQELGIVVGQPSVAESLAPLGGINPQIKAAVALLSVIEPLLPRHRFTATGVLQPMGNDGLGLTLSVRERGKFAYSQTFWAAMYETAAPIPPDVPRSFYVLALPAASWLEHTLYVKQGAKHPLTASAESFALFRAGARSQSEGDLGLARRLYTAALRVDKKNVGALGNLAIMNGRAGDFERAVKGLKRALRILEAS